MSRSQAVFVGVLVFVLVQALYTLQSESEIRHKNSASWFSHLFLCKQKQKQVQTPFLLQRKTEETLGSMKNVKSPNLLVVMLSRNSALEHLFASSLVLLRAKQIMVYIYLIFSSKMLGCQI